MKKICYLLLMLCAVSLQIQAQRASGNQGESRYAQTQKKITFAVQPFQVFNNGLRYDFEVRLGNGPGWLQFGPAFYYKTFNENENPGYYYEGKICHNQWLNWDLHEPFSGLKGGGLDLNYKHFIDPRRSVYVAFGVSYAHFDVKYWSWGLDGFIEDGLQYHAYSQRFRTQQIDRFGVNNFIGHQIPSRGAFLFDVFGGYAFRFASYDEDKPAFARNAYSYGYSGIVLLMGIRLGFGIR